MFGYTDNYIKVELPYKKELIGKIVDVRITGHGSSEDMTAEVVRS